MTGWMETFDLIVLTVSSHHLLDFQSQQPEIHSKISLPSCLSHIVTNDWALHHLALVSKWVQLIA